MIPFIDGRLLALGPWLAPAACVAGAALIIIAGTLIDRGIERRSAWRVAAGAVLGFYPAAIALAAAGIIS